MEVFIFFILVSSIFLHIEALDANRPSIKCSHGDPNIRLPFRLQGQHPHCGGHPTFELFCRLNKTMIHFPAYGDLVVKSVSYDIKKLSLLDTKNCVPEVFLNLNLSFMPFRYYYMVKNYTYLNCSAPISPLFQRVPCLSGLKFHVYVVEPSFDVPNFCKPVKTVAIPFSYSSYLSDDSFGLGLTWDLAGFKGPEAKGGWFEFLSNGVISVTIFIFVVAIMISAKAYYSKKLKLQKNQLEKLLGDRETLRPENCAIVHA